MGSSRDFKVGAGEKKGTPPPRPTVPPPSRKLPKRRIIIIVSALILAALLLSCGGTRKVGPRPPAASRDSVVIVNAGRLVESIRELDREIAVRNGMIRKLVSDSQEIYGRLIRLSHEISEQAEVVRKLTENNSAILEKLKDIKRLDANTIKD